MLIAPTSSTSSHRARDFATGYEADRAIRRALPKLEQSFHKHISHILVVTFLETRLDFHLKPVHTGAPDARLDRITIVKQQEMQIRRIALAPVRGQTRQVVRAN